MSKHLPPNPNAHVEGILRDIQSNLSGMEKRLTALLSDTPGHFEYSVGRQPSFLFAILGWAVFGPLIHR